METTRQERNDVVTLALAGRLDAFHAPELREALAAELDDARTRLVVDLEDVSFVDSSGIAALVRAMKAARQKGGDVRLCGLQAPVRIIFELTRLDKAFEILPDAATAEASFDS